MNNVNESHSETPSCVYCGNVLTLKTDYYSCDCPGLTEDKEIDVMNNYIETFNNKMKERPVTSLITCPYCKGAGGHFSAICYPEFMLCNYCYGKKYIDEKKDDLGVPTRLLNDDEFFKIFRPISELSQDKIKELNEVNDDSTT